MRSSSTPRTPGLATWAPRLVLAGSLHAFLVVTAVATGPLVTVAAVLLGAALSLRVVEGFEIALGGEAWMPQGNVPRVERITVLFGSVFCALAIAAFAGERLFDLLGLVGIAALGCFATTIHFVAASLPRREGLSFLSVVSGLAMAGLSLG